MLELEDDNGNLLPQEDQERVNKFIEHLKEINWFKPSKDLKKEEVEKHIKFTLKCFGLEAEIEFKSLDTPKDCDSAWDSAMDSAWDSAMDSASDFARDSACASARDFARDSAWASAWASAWDSARDSACASARDSAWDSTWDFTRDFIRDFARDSARDSAWASTEVLLENNKQFKEKYPDGAFIQLLKIWEMGLYPVGVLKDTGKFIVYVPPYKQELVF